MKQYLDKINKMRITTLAFMLWSACSILTQETAETLALKDVIGIALKNNYNVRIAENNLEKAKIAQHIGNADMLPEISTSARYNASNGNVEQNTFTGETFDINNAQNSNASVGITVQQTIFDGFRMFKVYDKLGKAKDFNDLKLKEEVENMTSQVIAAYYEVITAYEYLNLIQEALNVNNEQYRITKKSQELGKASLIDVLNIEVSLARDSSSLLDAQLNIKRSTNYLSFLLGGKDLTNVSFEKEFDLKEDLINSLMAFNTNENILIKQAQVNLQITELDYQIYRSSLMPQIFANVGYNMSNSQSDFGFANSTNSNSLSFGLTASWSIFQGYKRNIQLKTAKIDRLNQNITIEQITQNLDSDLNNAKTAYQGALNKINLQERNLGVYTKQFEVTKQLYDLGKTTAFELRQAQEQLIQAKNELFLAKKEAKIQEIELLRLSGKLIS